MRFRVKSVQAREERGMAALFADSPYQSSTATI